MKGEGIEINLKNIDKIFKVAIECLKENNVLEPAEIVVCLPRCRRVISNRYKGKGRPRKSDYNFKKIDWSKIVNNSELLK